MQHLSLLPGIGHRPYARGSTDPSRAEPRGLAEDNLCTLRFDFPMLPGVHFTLWNVEKQRFARRLWRIVGLIFAAGN